MQRNYDIFGLFFAAAVTLILLDHGAVLAAEKKNEPNNEISLGMNIELVKEILKTCKIEETGPMSFSKPADTDWLFHRLALHIDLVFEYSPKSRKIKRIMLYYGYPPYLKKDRVVLDARSIRFEKDGSYIVHFDAPYIDKPPQGKVKKVKPKTPSWKTR